MLKVVIQYFKYVIPSRVYTINLILKRIFGSKVSKLLQRSRA